MSGWVVVGLAAVVGLQIPVAAAIWVDARRLNLAEPHRYPIAIVYLVLFGWVLVPLYIRRRDELARADERETHETAAAVEDEGVTWRFNLDGLATLPTRIAFGLATVSRWLWVGWFVLLPSVMVGVSVFFEPVLGSYILFSLASLYMAASHGRRVTGSGAIDTDAEVLEQRWESGWTGGTDNAHETGLTAAESTKARRVGGYTVVRIEYEEPRLPRLKGFLVPTNCLQQVTRALEACGVEVQETTGRQADWRGPAAVAGRSLVTLLTVGLVVVALWIP